MKCLAFAIPLLAVTLCSPPLSAAKQTGNAQVTQPDPRIRITKETLADGTSLLTVQNFAKAFITGMLVAELDSSVAGQARLTGMRVFDSVVNLSYQRPLPQYQSHTFVLSGPHPSLQQAALKYSLRAVIFSDGSTWGDSAYIQKLLRIRRLDYQYTKQALEMVQSARKNGTPCSRLAEEADQAAKTKMQAAEDIVQKGIARNAFGDISVFMRANARACGTGAPPATLLDLLLSRFFNKEASLLHSKPSVASARTGGSPGH